MTLKITKKYGIAGDFDESVVDQIAIRLDVQLRVHDSSHWGEYWLCKELECELKIYCNVDPMHDPDNDDPKEHYFDYDNRDCGMLIDLYGESERVLELQGILMGIKNIKHRAND